MSAALWTESHTNVTVRDGIFNIVWETTCLFLPLSSMGLIGSLG